MSEALRVLVVHNRYTLRGGEDAVVDAEVAALRARGHEVLLHEVTNEEPEGGARAKVAAARTAVWNRAAAAELATVVETFGPGVAHVHNHSWQLSPAIYRALDRAGVPVVATLHNYRTTCSNAYLLRDGVPCELCVGAKASWQGIKHRCFQDSRAASAMVAGTQLSYRRAAVPTIARWIALTQFGRGVFVRAGLPEERIVVRPNMVEDPGPVVVGERPPVALFVGRLEAPKGVDVLLDAWLHDGPERPAGARLVIVGGGPAEAALRTRANGREDVEVLGELGADEVAALQRTARVAVVPSRWYEGFGRVVIEAFAASTPVIVSDHGALAELVRGDVGDAPGWGVAPNDPASLAAAMTEALVDPAEAARRGAVGRSRFEASYSVDRCMGQLETIYADALSDAARASRA